MARTEGDRYLPVQADDGLTVSDEDNKYADDFVVTARAVEGCKKAEDVTLLLSTCRNHWMTVNAAFTDLKEAAGASERPDPITNGLYELRREHWEGAAKALGEAGMALAQVDAKLRVWNERHELMAELRASIAALPELRDRNRMTKLLEQQSGAQSTDEHDADGRYVALAVDEHDDAARLLKELLIARTKLGAAVAAARSIRATAPAAELTLLDAGGEDADAQRWSRLLDRLSGTKWAGGSGHTVAEVLALDLPAPDYPSAVGSAQFRTTVLASCERVLGDVQDLLADRFRPNLSRPPMPAPYIIDFTRMRRPATGRVRRFTTELHRGRTNPAPEHARLALLRCGVPKQSYSSDTIARYRREERDDTARVAALARTALEQAVAHEADFLALGECFLPESALDELLARAEDAGIGLVAGLEYGSERIVNNAVVAIPGVAGVVTQQKQTPSKYELQVAADGRVRKFLDTKLGVLAVVVCSDLLELDYLWSLASSEPRLDTVIVCARNHNPEIFARLAGADAVRLHAHVAVVNVFAPDSGLASGHGTTVFAPKRASGELPPTGTAELGGDPWEEIETPELAWWDLPVAALALRDTHDTLHTYCAAPHFTRLPPEPDQPQRNGTG